MKEALASRYLPNFHRKARHASENIPTEPYIPSTQQYYLTTYPVTRGSVSTTTILEIQQTTIRMVVWGLLPSWWYIRTLNTKP